MTPDQQQLTAALMLLKDLGQERINQMGAQLQAVVGPTAQDAVNLLSQLIIQPSKPDKEIEAPPP